MMCYAYSPHGSCAFDHLPIHLTVGCWNVTTLETPLAAKNVEAALNNYCYGVTHMADSFFMLEFVSAKARCSLVLAHCKSNRTTAVCLHIKGGMLLQVAIYAPTSAAPNDEINRFYQELECWLAINHKRRKCLIIEGDLMPNLAVSTWTCKRSDHMVMMYTMRKMIG